MAKQPNTILDYIRKVYLPRFRSMPDDMGAEELTDMIIDELDFLSGAEDDFDSFYEKVFDAICALGF